MNRLAFLTLTLGALGCKGSCDLAAGDAANGETLYASACAGCHGDDGSGGSAQALTGEVPEKDDCELVDILVDGYEDMPATGLTEDEAADVVAWLHDTVGAYEGEE